MDTQKIKKMEHVLYCGVFFFFFNFALVVRNNFKPGRLPKMTRAIHIYIAIVQSNLLQSVREKWALFFLS